MVETPQHEPHSPDVHDELDRALNAGEPDENEKIVSELRAMITSGDPKSIEAAEGMLDLVELPPEQESVMRSEIARVRGESEASTVASTIKNAHAPVVGRLMDLIHEAGRKNDAKKNTIDVSPKVTDSQPSSDVSRTQTVIDVEASPIEEDDGVGQEVKPEIVQTDTGTETPSIPVEQVSAPSDTPTEESVTPEVLSAQQKTGIVDEFLAGQRKETAQPNTAEQIKTPEEISLDKAREAYVAALHQYKEKKPALIKMMESIGVEARGKTLVEPRELTEAKKAYIQAKENMHKSIRGSAGFKVKKIGEGTGGVEVSPSLLGQSPLGAGDTVSINGTDIEASGDFSRITYLDKGAIAFAEKEMDTLERAMEQVSTPLEKNILRKSLDAYRKVPLVARVGLTSAVLGAASGAAIGALAWGATVKVGWALGGAALGKVAANTLNTVFEKAHKQKKEEMTGDYADVYNDGNKEDDFLAALQKEIRKKKAERVATAGAAIAVGGVATLGSVMGENILESSDTTDIVGRKISPEEALAHRKADLGELNNGDSPDAPTKGRLSNASEVGASKNVTAENPIRVELSSKGFMQTFEDMKTKLLEQYGSVDKVPPAYKHFVDTPSSKLAEDFGFYKPKEGLSGMGYAGEALELKNNKLVYDTLGDKDSVLFDGGKQTAQFSGTMFSPEKPSVDDVAGDTAIGESSDESDVVDETVPETINDQTKEDMPDTGSPVKEVARRVVPEPDPVQSVVEQSTPMFDTQHTRIMAVGGKNITVLNEHLQNKIDPETLAIKKQFAQAFEVAAKNWELPIKKTIPFEGGRIDIVELGGKHSVLLNGEPFAEGVTGKSIKLLPGKGSFWTETIYERAFGFKEVKEAIKQITTPKKP